MLLLAHTGIGSAVNVLRYRLVTHCAGSVEPGASCPFNRYCIPSSYLSYVDTPTSCSLQSHGRDINPSICRSSPNVARDNFLFWTTRPEASKATRVSRYFLLWTTHKNLLSPMHVSQNSHSASQPGTSCGENSIIQILGR